MWVLSSMTALAAELPVDDRLEHEKQSAQEILGTGVKVIPRRDCTPLEGAEREVCELGRDGSDAEARLLARGPAAIAPLEAALLEERTSESAAFTVLKRLGEPAIPALIRITRQAKRHQLQGGAADALVALGPRALAPVAAELASVERRPQSPVFDPEEERRHALARETVKPLFNVLARLGKEGVAKLEPSLLSDDPLVAFNVILELKHAGADAVTLQPALLSHYARTSSAIDRQQLLELFGDIGTVETRAVLLAATKDQSFMVRSGAATGLARLPKQRVDAAVMRALEPLLNDPEPVVRTSAMRARGKLGACDVVAMRTALGAPAAYERVAAARALARCSTGAEPKAIAAMVALLRDAGGEQRVEAAEVLQAFGPRARPAEATLVATLSERDQSVGFAAASALARLGPSGVRRLETALRGADGVLARRAAMGLSDAEGASKAAVSACLAGLASTDDVLLSWVAESCGRAKVRDARAVAALLPLLASRSMAVRTAAARAMGDLGLPAAAPAVPTLLAQLPKPEENSAYWVADSLARLGSPETLAALEDRVKTADAEHAAIARDALRRHAKP